MKKLAEIMDELGFDPEGSPAVKEAFVKYLIKSSQGVSVLTPTEKDLIRTNPKTVRSLPSVQKSLDQLQFSFMLEPSPTSAKKPKTS
jgi:hypothetical protein